MSQRELKLANDPRERHISATFASRVKNIQGCGRSQQSQVDHPRRPDSSSRVLPHQLSLSSHTAAAQFKYSKYYHTENMLIVSWRLVQIADELMRTFTAPGQPREAAEQTSLSTATTLQECGQGDIVAYSPWLPRLMPSVLFRRLPLLWGAICRAHQGRKFDLLQADLKWQKGTNQQQQGELLKLLKIISDPVGVSWIQMAKLRNVPKECLIQG